MRSIAIIGSGPTAIYTAHYLLLQEEPLAVTVFEAQAEAGKGTPYHQDWNEKEMLANIASIEIPPVNQALTSWLEAQSDYALMHMGVARADIDERAFFPRVALGAYFHAQLEALMQRAPVSGSSLAVKTRHKVQDVKALENGVELTVRNSLGNIQHVTFDYVVMATGHAWPPEPEVRPGYFLSPWPSRALAAIPHCHVGIRGTSLSAIDAMVTLAVARGSFRRDCQGRLKYLCEPGTEAFHVTLMSRKGILPEADFFHPIPYEPLQLCTQRAVDAVMAKHAHADLLDSVFGLFKAELAACDPDYAARIGLDRLALEGFASAYFKEREEQDPFVWAERNLAEARANRQSRHTVAWRYAILRMHEVIARIVPQLAAEDFLRFDRFFKPVFVDDYATVPHASIERLLAMREAGKLDVLKLGDAYRLDTDATPSGALLVEGERCMYFPAFIEATGQRPLSVQAFPFHSLWEQGLVQRATARYTGGGQLVDVGGIALDRAYHPVSGSALASRLYCVSLPFMLGQFPFAQGITSSHDMGKKVAEDIMLQLRKKETSPPMASGENAGMASAGV